MSSRHLINPAVHDPSIEQILPDPGQQLSQALISLTQSYPPQNIYSSDECHGLYSGPTSIAYLFLHLSRTHPQLKISGHGSLSWAKAYLAGQRSTALVTASRNVVINEALAFHAIRAALTQDFDDVKSLIRNIKAGVVTAEQGSNEWLYGRAGCLYLLRLVRSWVQGSDDIVKPIIEDLIQLILSHGPSWLWHGKDYLGKRPQGIKKQGAIRKSARLQAKYLTRKQSISRDNSIRKGQALPPPASNPPASNPPASNILQGRTASRHPQVLQTPSKPHQNRKRGQEAGHPSPRDREQPPRKRPRTSPPSCTAKEGLKKQAASETSDQNADPLEYWIRTKRWPKEYFEQDSQVREDLEQDSWLEEQMEYSTEVVQYVEFNGQIYPRPVRKAPTSLRRKQSDSSLTGSSDQTKRESKSVAYRDTRYTTLLAAKGSFTNQSDLGITDTSKSLCRRLLESAQDVPKDSLFRDNLFEKTCRKIQDRNEARVIQDISRLIVPSAETLATYGATDLEHLIEGVNEGWTGSIAVQGPRPQPDYSVGFRRSAFTDEQLNKLNPLIGSVYDNSLFVATYRMYFPFLTCEVKCGAAALDVADRQNAHSMTCAIRGVVELYKAVKREKELHREILAFSISHDHRVVRIYGHYVVIVGDKTTFYCHPIRTFDFTEQDGKEKWSAYTFTKNVYDIWMPIHLKRICLAIDKLPPDIDFGLSQSASFPHDLDLRSSQQSNTESTSLPKEGDSQSSLVASQNITPDTSFSHRTEREYKKPKNNRTSGQQR